jgi:capsular exopolysaccharide synthesis family protein
MKTIEKTASTDGQAINLRDLWRIFQKRKWIVIATALIIFGVVTVISLLTVRTYTAKGQILIEREPNILSFENMFQIEPLSDDYYQTQYKLLQSRSLAGNTIDRVKLTENKEFVADVLKSGLRPGTDPKTDPIFRRRLVTWFLDRLNVQPLRKTRLVDISFGYRDARLAADILNALIDSYIAMNIDRKYQATEQATDFLATQIETVRNEIEGKERQLQEYGRSKNIIALSNNENTVVETLGGLNRALTDARIDRINKETYYNEIKTAGPDYIPSALNGSLVQRLGEEYSRLSRDYAKKSETFLPDYPEIQSLKAELDKAKKDLEEETKALIGRAYTDFQAALSREQALAAEFGKQRGAAFQLNSNAIQYNSLTNEIRNSKNLLESLMTRKSEADVSSRLKGFRTSNIWVVDRAEIPLSPSSPNTAKNMVLGLLVGLFVGLGLALLYENLDVTVKDAEDVQQFAGVPTLGMIPMLPKGGLIEGEKAFEEKSGLAEAGDKMAEAWASLGLGRREPKGTNAGSMDLVVQFSPESAFAEQYRSVRTSLLFSMEETNKRALAVTSPLPQDGKTATACNLAASLAQAGKRVVIIDADLRKPRLHKVFGMKNLNGLTKYLTTGVVWEDLLRATPISTLFLINAGPIPPNPLELLGSGKMAALIGQLKQDFDFVLVDTPPVLAVSDALVLGSRLDGAIMVVRRGRTPREALKRAQEKLDTHKIKNLGVVINGVRVRDLDEYHVSSYYGHRRRSEG